MTRDRMITASSSARMVRTYDDIMRTYDPSKNKTPSRLSKYEKTHIIGVRMEQIARSGRCYVEVDENEPFDPYAIALRELEQKRLPFMLRRTLPNGEKEYWRLMDMVIS